MLWVKNIYGEMCDVVLNVVCMFYLGEECVLIISMEIGFCGLGFGV